MTNTKGTEDYLEAMYRIEQQGGAIKSVKVAEMLGVTKPAVNQATKELISQGYINKVNYGDITLTEIGRDIAKKTLEKHSFLTELLVKLGVDDVTAEKEACLIEHIISDTTLNKIRIYLDSQKQYDAL